MTSDTNITGRIPMWMDAYLQDTLIREHIAEARHRADRDHALRALRRVRPPRARRSAWALVAFLRRPFGKPTARPTFDSPAPLDV
jgi:hypothetical protein